jgi:hypothetical protein
VLLGKKDKAAEKRGIPGAKMKDSGDVSRVRPGMADVVAGESKVFIGNLAPFLPQELIGGSIPHVPGTEDDAVWNAASQACGTEKVHYTYTVDEGKVWYLACPSSTLASNPDSWCPLSAALPGNSEYWDRETVYLYEQEGIASALRWDPETSRMQIFLGASRTILPRVQSMDANFVTINADVADIVPWKNKNLRTEQLSRATVRMLVFIGVLITLAAAGILLFSITSINFLERNLGQVKRQSQTASTDLMMKAYQATQSDTAKHMVRIQEILDSLAKVDGTLVRYEVKGKSVEWEAIIPPAFAANFGTPSTDGVETDGRVRVISNK